MSEPAPPFQVKAIADYTAASGSELSLTTGQELTVTGSDGRGVWWQSIVNGAVGWFPASYVQIIDSPPADTHTPPAPAPTPAVNTVASSNNMQRSPSVSSVPASAAAPKRAGSVSTVPAATSGGANEKAPATSKTHIEKNKKNLPTTVKVQIVEGRDLRPVGDVKKTSPTAFVFVKSFSESKERLFEGTATVKGTIAPRWNETFHLCVTDAEAETIIIRVVSGKDPKDSKKFLGEIQFPLRGAIRDYDAPNGHYKWHNLTGKEAKGQLHIFIEYTDTRVTSAPTNFQRVSHIGWSADGGFDISNIPAEWKRLFKSVGIKKSDLEDKDLAKKVFDIVQNYESAGGDVGQSMDALAPPPPPPAAQTNDQGQTYQVWDEASQSYFTLDQAQYDEYMRNYNEYAAQYSAWQQQQQEYEKQMAEYNASLQAQADMPPPPPLDDDMPPPPPEDGDFPPPPPPPSMDDHSGGAGGPPPPPPMAKAPPAMPKVNVDRKSMAPPPPPVENRNDLLSSIRNFSGGLKSAANAPAPPPPAPSGGGGGGSLQDMLRNAMTTHRHAMAEDEVGEDDDDDDW